MALHKGLWASAGILACYLSGAVVYAVAGATQEDLPLSEVRTLCGELGVTAECLAVMGISAPTVEAALDDLAEQVQLVGSFRDAAGELAILTPQVRNLREALRAAPDEMAAIPIQRQIDAMLADLTTAEATAASSRSQLLAILVPGTVDSGLAMRVLNCAGPSTALPPEYRVAELTDSQIAELLGALAAERRAQSQGQELDSGIQQVLAQFRANPAIATAISNRDTHLAGIRRALMD